MHLTHLIGTHPKTKGMNDCCPLFTRRRHSLKNARNGTLQPSTTDSYPIASLSPATTTAKRTKTMKKTSHKPTPKTYPSPKSTAKRYWEAEAGRARRNYCPSGTPTSCGTVSGNTSRRKGRCTTPSTSPKTAFTRGCGRSARCHARCWMRLPSRTTST